MTSTKVTTLIYNSYTYNNIIFTYTYHFSYIYFFIISFISYHNSYTFHVILYFTSCSCNCILSSHSSAMLLIPCHILFSFIYCTCSYTIFSYDFHMLYLSYTFRSLILYFLYLYTCHFLLGFMSANTLEADTGITICTRRYYHCTRQ